MQIVNEKTYYRVRKQTGIVRVAFTAPSSVEATVSATSAAWRTVVRLCTKSTHVHIQLS